jgi:hypothetical protein
MQVFCPAAAAVGEVLAVGNQPLVQVAGEQRDAVGAGVMAEEVAAHADLAAALCIIKCYRLLVSRHRK